MKIFVDNDVILDVLLERQDFQYSKRLFTLIDKKQVEAYTSPLIFSNSFYIIRKLSDKKRAWTLLKKLRLLFRISNISEDIVDFALASDFSDFEDAIQYYAALKQNVDYLVTRNKKHYISTHIPVVSPQEYIALAQLS